MNLADRRGEFELTSLEFEAHCQDSRVLERRKGQPTLLGHTDSTGCRLLTRVWYPKSRWSSDRIWPYRDRFGRALHLLRERGIRVPVERARGRVGTTGVRLLVVEEIEGTPLRNLRSGSGLQQFAGYLANLHAQGVYCRGLHLGSVLALDAGGFALIDVTDTKLLGRPLPMRMRERNLGILCANPADLAFMQDGRWSELVMDYCRAANLTLTQSAGMLDRVRGQIERRRVKREQPGELRALGL